MKMGYITLFNKIICLALLFSCMFTKELRSRQQICKAGESNCNPDASPYTCLIGPSKGGCNGDPSYWPKNGCPNQCKISKTPSPGPTPTPTPIPIPTPDNSSINWNQAGTLICKPGESFCNPDAAPYTCLAGNSKGGCHGDPSHWPKNGCPNQCKISKTPQPGPTPTPTPTPMPTPLPTPDNSSNNGNHGGILNLRNCPNNHGEVRVLVYNLFWWNLFGQRKGNNKSAGNLINKANSEKPLDFMGFQECDDINRILADSQLQDYGSFSAGHALAFAWRKSTWDSLFMNQREVGEDRREQYWGKRYAAFGRFRNKQTNKTVFFINVHGPLPVNTGGVGGGKTYAENILRVIRENAQSQDMVILVGDFNQDPNSETIQTLEKHITRAYSGVSFGGVDTFFSNCRSSQQKNLGNGGSDHDALSSVFSS